MMQTSPGDVTSKALQQAGSDTTSSYSLGGLEDEEIKELMSKSAGGDLMG